MMLLSVCICGLLGWCGLALSQDRHHRQVAGTATPAGTRLPLRLFGWAMLAVSLGLCVGIYGAATGAVAWLGLSSVTAPAVVLILCYYPAWLRLLLVPFGPRAGR